MRLAAPLGDNLGDNRDACSWTMADDGGRGAQASHV
jgi:hypothetical protein